MNLHLMNVKDNWFTLFSKLTKVLKSKIQNILLPFPTVFYPPETSGFVVLNNYYVPGEPFWGSAPWCYFRPVLSLLPSHANRYWCSLK